MTAPRRGQRRRRPQNQQRNIVRDLWAPTPALEAPDPIKPVANPTALIDSLGQPPLRGQSAAAQYHLAAVIERAAILATALAASAEVLAEPDGE